MCVYVPLDKIVPEKREKTYRENKRSSVEGEQQGRALYFLKNKMKRLRRKFLLW